MSVLDSLASDSAQDAARNLRNQAFTIFMRLKGHYEDTLQSFWQNPQATPQEIADALGTSGVELFQLHGLLYTFLKAARPSEPLTELTALGAFTPNQDGTIIIDRVGPE
jgi:hypothetical protein